jgi:hypothetical protein
MTQEQLRGIRDWMDMQRTRPGPALKVPVLVGSREALERLLEDLSACSGFARRRSLPLEDSSLDPFGSVGEIRLGDGLTLWLAAVPTEEGFAPLWEVVAHGALGSLVLLDAPVESACPRVARGAAALAQRSGRPLVALVAGGAEAPDRAEGRLRSGVEALDEAPALRIGQGTTADRLASLRKAFARFAP